MRRVPKIHAPQPVAAEGQGLGAQLRQLVTHYSSPREDRVPRGLGNLMEVFVVFIRDEIVIPNMGPGGPTSTHRRPARR